MSKKKKEPTIEINWIALISFFIGLIGVTILGIIYFIK